MSSKLIDLVNTNRQKLSELQISIDEIQSAELEFKEEAEQVDLYSETAMARITLFKSNRLYVQVLNIENEETLYFFDGYLDNNVDMGDFIMGAILTMNK